MRAVVTSSAAFTISRSLCHERTPVISIGAAIRFATSTTSALISRETRNAESGLSFLSQTRVRAAYLGLWREAAQTSADGPDEDETLELADSFVADGSAVLPVGSLVGARSFPPSSLVSLARPAAREITIVFPVRTGERTGASSPWSAHSRHWRRRGATSSSNAPALLCVALEQLSTVESLRSSEERYALAASAANDGLWDWDLATGTVHYSDRWKAVIGHRPDEIGTDPTEWLGRVHPEDRAALDARLSECASGGSTALESEHRLRHSDGSYRWVHCRALAIPGEPSPATRLVGSITDVTERRDLEEQLRHQALHDTLTGLPNRTLLLDRTERMLAAARRNDSSVTLLLIDFDNFKEVNDGFGHAAGDELLAAVVDPTSGVIRDTDTVGRLGGDEFVVVADSGTSAEASALLAERVRDVLHPPFHLSGHEYMLGASIGIATGSDGAAESLLHEADLAMYQAKKSGKNHDVSFQPQMQHDARTRLRLEMDLASAIRRGQLHLHYQPIYHLEPREVYAMEALVRWQHPERGLLAPSDFVPVAEVTGRLILDLGRYVLAEACRAAAGWRKRGSLPGHRREPVCPPARVRRDHPRRLPSARRKRPRSLPARARGHRDGVDARPHRRGRPHHQAERARRAPLDRRLRHGLLLADLAPAVSPSTG